MLRRTAGPTTSTLAACATPLFVNSHLPSAAGCSLGVSGTQQQQQQQRSIHIFSVPKANFFEERPPAPSTAFSRRRSRIHAAEAEATAASADHRSMPEEDLTQHQHPDFHPTADTRHVYEDNGGDASGEEALTANRGDGHHHRAQHPHPTQQQTADHHDSVFLSREALEAEVARREAARKARVATMFIPDLARAERKKEELGGFHGGVHRPEPANFERIMNRAD